MVKKLLNRFFGIPYKERVVYTCLFGFSEKFKDRSYPKYNNTDYICFTDDKSLSSKQWRFIYIDTSLYGPQKTSKMIKICPHLFLKEYKSSLYVDNTVRINADIDTIFLNLSDNSPFVIYKHNLWDCPYTESEAVIKLGYADKILLSKQIESYNNDGLPRNCGLYHGAILL
ncbi:DUF616 domain-containing protein, partial [Salmonella enterica subsp. enterica serovar Alachua]|nr:DUF616 domain-containing protein [Salmonella enterica subsp. enterica serovar Alachua]